MATIYKQKFPPTISKSPFEHLSGPILNLNHPGNHSNTHKKCHRNRSSSLGMYKRHTTDIHAI